MFAISLRYIWGMSGACSGNVEDMFLGMLWRCFGLVWENQPKHHILVNVYFCINGRTKTMPCIIYSMQSVVTKTWVRLIRVRFSRVRLSRVEVSMAKTS